MMKLMYTPRSHFARKVRILWNAYGQQQQAQQQPQGLLQLVDIGNPGNNVASAFGPNPMMKVPTLIDERASKEKPIVLFESDHISQYLVRSYFQDKSDIYQVLSADVDHLNARAVLNTVMSNEVEVLLARRSGLDTTKLARFDKLLQSIAQGLHWLESNPSVFAARSTSKDAYASYLGFHLVCAVDHLRLYDIVPLTEYRNLNAIVMQLSTLTYVNESLPQ